MRFLGWHGGDEGGPSAGRITGVDLMRKAEERLRLGPISPLRAAGAEIWHWNLSLGADPALEPTWRALLEGRGLAVVTGQQPALLGGPLYTLYKLLTAVGLARRLERALGTPCLAVFWLVGDDADFGEVASCHLPAADARVLKLRDPEAPTGGTLIGALPAGRQTAVLREAPAVLGGLPGGDRLLSWCQEAAVRGKTWSGLQAALFYRLLPGLPFLVLDGGQEEVLRAQSAWLLRTAETLPLADLLREGGNDAKDCGFDPALDPELGRRALFRIEGDRRVPLADQGRPGDLVAPNVVLRPALQDLLLPNVATVCGPAEIRYRAQLGPVYRAARVPEPLRLPRLKGALLPGLEPRFFSGEAAYMEALSEPDRFVAGVLAQVQPDVLLGEIEALRERLLRGLEGLRMDLTSYDPSLGQVLDSAAGKIDYQAQRLRDGVVGKARHRLFQEEPRLAHWKEFVRPREEEQERVLSWLTPYLTEDAVETTTVLLSAAEEHLDRILDQDEPAATGLFLLGRGGGA